MNPRRPLAVLTSAAVLGMLAACANGGENTGASNTETSAAAANNSGQTTENGRTLEGNLYLGEGLPIVKEPVDYSMMISYTLGKRDPNDMALYKERDEKTGVRISYDYVLATAVNERKATALASDDMPDMIANILTNDDISTYGGSGMLVELDDYMDKYMPRLKKMLADNPEVEKASRTPDGKLYGFPAPNAYSLWPGDGKYIRTSQLINKKWLDELGLAMPETTDDLVNVLTAFRDKDPNHNGKQDEIPYSFQYSDTWAGNFGETVFGPFGVIGPGTNKFIQDGKTVLAIQANGYKEAITYAKKLYADGLIDPEAFTQDASRYRAKGSAETPVYGLLNGWTGDLEVGPTRIGMETSDTVEYVPLPPLKGPAGTRLWNNSISGLNTNRLVITTSAKNPEVLMRYVDEMYEADNSIQEVYGMFDHQTKKLGDGKWQGIQSPEGWNGEEWLRDTTTRVLPSYISNEMAENFLGPETPAKPDGETKKDSLKYRFAEVFAPYAMDAGNVYPPVMMSREEAEEIARILPQIENAIKEQEVKWITNKGDITTEYDGFMKKLDGLQLPRLMEIYQGAYERWIK
ncbi:extracellular solute-binding protein [Paenibacillus sp. MWE-103]|uniref:Extracellular solute-binding protein n=1 Tax=Paenibacillus artemisiicola TaxID=1172618 RepID=A0ABS3WDD4_9BACL|nr:extracellular solute-binding protein [Paenibacillus artemisiicola]MBO7746356.1 extracellular solute-binding protein [Paenibacillus artemisiicola]